MSRRDHDAFFEGAFTGISLAKIASMFWIVAINCLANTPIHDHFFGVSRADTVKSVSTFLTVVERNPWKLDRVLYVLSQSGWSGVVAFVFLSGLGLFLSVLRSGSFHGLDWFRKRLVAVYFPYLLAVCVSYVLYTLVKGNRLVDGVLQVMILGAVRLFPPAKTINSPLWFMTPLLCLYLAFPVIVYVFVRFRLRGLLGVFGFSLLGLGTLGPGRGSSLVAARDRLFSGVGIVRVFFPVFVAGIVAAVLSFRAAVALQRRRAISRSGIALLLAAAAVVGTYVVVQTCYTLPRAYPFEVWDNDYPYLTGIAFAIPFLCLGALAPRRTRKWLDLLARGTFSIFLYHFLLIPAFAAWLTPARVGGHFGLALIAQYVLLLLVAVPLQLAIDRLMRWLSAGLLTARYDVTVEPQRAPESSLLDGLDQLERKLPAH